MRQGKHPSSMSERMGRLTTLLLRWLLSSVVFAQRHVDAIRDAESRGTVVYVMKSRNLVDYLYFNMAFVREGLRLVRFANGLNAWLLRPALRGIATLLRGRRGFPSEEDCLEATVDAGEPAMLFLTRPRRSETEELEFSLPHLKRLIATQRRQSRPILVLPQLLVWEKRPERARPSILDEVFGSRHRPGFIKSVIYVFQNWWQSFLNLGAPLVRLSTQIDLRNFIQEQPDLSDEALALELRDRLSDVLIREQRVVVGPWVKRSRQMRDEILADARTQEALARVTENDATERTKLLKESRKILQEIAADFSMLQIKIMSAIMTPAFKTIYDGFEYDAAQLDKVRDIAMNKRIVFVPSHKSHVDYLVLSYILFQEGMIPPHIAAGANLDLPVVGGIFRRSGAFFLRRSFADDPIYFPLFKAYLIKLLEEGFFIEFFIEGTRSRTGKLNPPRYGMLNMIVEAFRLGDVEDIAFVPISVAYEKIIEGNSYKDELEGGEKKSENIGDLVKVGGVLQSKYGRVYVEFGEAIELAGFLDRYHADPDSTIPPDELDRTVRRLGYSLIHGINDVTVVTPSSVAALILLNSPARALDDKVLAREAGFVIAFLRERSAPLSRTLADSIKLNFAAIHRPRARRGALLAGDRAWRRFIRAEGLGSRRRGRCAHEN